MISALLAENPGYEAAITFINIDRDLFADDPPIVGLNIPRRPTLVVLKGDQELGRIVAGKARDAIQAPMDRALTDATA